MDPATCSSSLPICKSPSGRSAAQVVECPWSPSAKGMQPEDSSPRSPLALDAARSPASNPLEHVIVTDSPPHKQLQAGAFASSTPRSALPAFLQPLAAVLQRCVDLNAAACPPQGNGSTAAAAQERTPYHGIRPPPIGIAAYLERIAKYAKCSPVCFIMAETYMERLAKGDEALRPGPLNVHRLLLTGVLLAAKLMDDHYYNNAYYAKIGGVALEELNSLELVMMQQLGWQLRVGALPITQTLAHIGATADAPDAQLAAWFGALLQPAAIAAIRAAAAAQPPVAAPAHSEWQAAAGSCAGERAPAAAACLEQQRRSSLDCGVAACVIPFVSSGIAAH